MNGTERSIREKLHFADTDIMRMWQYARSKTRLPAEGVPGGRVAINVYELCHAIHAWKRQIQLHIAHAKWGAV